MAALTSTDALARLAAWGLPGVPATDVHAAAPDELLVLLDHHHVTGHALAAADAGALEVEPGWLEALSARHLDLLRRSLHAEAVLVEAAALLDAGGVPTRVLKGCATAHLDHPDPALRLVRDVDLLVAPGRLADARHALGPIVDGAPATAPRVWAWTDRFGKEVAVSHVEGIELDLHLRLVQGYFGLAIDAGELFDAGEGYTVAGRRLHALDAPGRLVHAALHTAATGRLSLHSARDVAQVVLVTGADWRTAVDRCRRWRVEALLASGVVRVWDALGLPPHPLAAWARGSRSRGRQRAASALAQRARGDQRLSGPLALPPWEWPAYLGPLLRPGDSHLGARGRSRRQHWRAGLDKLRPRR